MSGILECRPGFPGAQSVLPLGVEIPGPPRQAIARGEPHATWKEERLTGRAPGSAVLSTGRLVLPAVG